LGTKQNLNNAGFEFYICLLIKVKMDLKLNSEWANLLKPEFSKDYFVALTDFINREYNTKTIYPPADKIFSAFNLCCPVNCKVVIIGQDPYHGLNQANGLCFSVADGVKVPPSLRNIFKELQSDLNLPAPSTGNLEKWAKQGVLLLNATLTVRAGEAGSHQKRGWETFTDATISVLSNTQENIVFMLWGAFAQKKEVLIDADKHLILKAAHPSPLSAYNGFFGCRHFSKANNYLATKGREVVNW
jgi:uracil-DNA glycosylase